MGAIRLNLVACALAVGFAARVLGAPFYEAFDYTNGVPLSGNVNNSAGAPLTWNYVGTGAAGVADPVIGSGSLAYGGFNPSAGNSVLTDRGQAGVSRINLPAAVNSGTVYYSMLVRVNDMTGLTNTTTGSFFGGLNSGVGAGTSVTTAGAALMIHRDAIDAKRVQPRGGGDGQ